MASKVQKKSGVNASGIATHLCCSAAVIREYVARKVIEKMPNGRFDPDVCRAKAFAHLRELAAGRRGDGSTNELAKEKAALAREQRETAALKNAQTW